MRRSGLRLAIDATWVAGNGYRPVRVTLTPARPGPAVSERTILLELYPSAWMGASDGVGVTQVVTLSEGSTEVTETVLVPQYGNWGNVRIDVWEDGGKLEDLSLENYGLTSGREWTEGVPKVLIVDSDAPPRHERDRLLTSAGAGATAVSANSLPDIRGLVNYLPTELQVSVESPATDLDLLRHISQLAGFEMIPPGDAPQSWLGYTCLDLVFVSHIDLRRMLADEPARFRALGDWVMAGGTLCVYGVGESFERLADLETVCDVPPLDHQDGAAYRGWTAPDKQLVGTPVAAFDALEAMRQARSGVVPMTDSSGNVVRENGLAPHGAPVSVAEEFQPPFVFRSWGVGTLVAFGPQDTFPGTDRQWELLLNSLGTERWMWYQRHGVSLRRENDDFWNFLVPGVGKAPVGAFRILITLFIVGIGPVNYLLLRRWGRLNWLLATVPLGALVVTSGLLGYAMVSDGLGARVRIRSFTHIDQRAGQAISWSRQSYYAGLAPSAGLLFPTDTAIYPLAQYPRTEYSRGTWSSPRVHWDNRQRLERGYISSRVTSQLVAVRSHRTLSRLKIAEGPDQNAAPTVANQLGADLYLLWLRDKTGNYFRAQDIPPGGDRQLSLRSVGEARSELAREFARYRPSFPEGFTPGEDRGAFAFMRSYRGYYWGTDSSLPEPRMETSVLEEHLRKAQLGFPRHTDLVPGSFVAITSRPGEVPLGIDHAREEASFHVVTGTW
jgi:hypothetical protein